MIRRSLAVGILVLMLSLTLATPAAAKGPESAGLVGVGSPALPS